MNEERMILSHEPVPRYRILFYIAILVAVLYLGIIFIDFFVHKHTEFPWEEAPEFLAAYGFFSCVLLVFIAKALRLFIKRKEHYYD